jgi:anti-sigma regulatory factor (Ser/Thr protein kinase)
MDDAPEDGVRAAREADGELLLVLDNTLDAIEGGRRRIARHLEPLALSARTTNRLEVVFEELISNIVRHGTGAGLSILVSVAAQPDTIRLTIEDDGRPFNPFAIDEPPPFESLETAKIGGLGIPVVRRFCSQLAYEAGAASPAWSEFVRQGARPANRVTAAIAAQA